MDKRTDNPKKFIGLRRKMLWSMVFLLLLLGSATAFINQKILFRVLKTEFQNRGLIHARSIAANSLTGILTQNNGRLNKLLNDEKKISEDIAYIFILNSSNRVLAHTFSNGFPKDLAAANALPKNKDFKIQLLDTRLGTIYDINVPVLLDKSPIGQVRLGIYQNSIQRTIILIDSVILFVTLLIILIGIILAYKISALITQPISKLVQATESIQKGDFAAKIDIRTKDEFSILAAAFNKMAVHLNQSMQEISRLTKYKEREKIALDLHDNCAQDLANLIKRLELCERLFKIEPLKAFAEINNLKENIRGHLSKTRQIIYGLKSPQDGEFVLSQQITEYINNFQKNNEVNVKLEIPGSFPTDLASDRARDIFYIISEALVNVKKHAQAKNVELGINYNGAGELTINIKDDGKGFDIENSGSSGVNGKWGLMGMRQRAVSLGGTLAMHSQAGEGTQIHLRVQVSGIQYNI